MKHFSFIIYGEKHLSVIIVACVTVKDFILFVFSHSLNAAEVCVACDDKT